MRRLPDTISLCRPHRVTIHRQPGAGRRHSNPRQTLPGGRLLAGAIPHQPRVAGATQRPSLARLMAAMAGVTRRNTLRQTPGATRRRRRTKRLLERRTPGATLRRRELEHPARGDIRHPMEENLQLGPLVVGDTLHLLARPLLAAGDSSQLLVHLVLGGRQGPLGRQAAGWGHPSKVAGRWLSGR